MKVLVTGAHGFVGHRVVAALKCHGHEVVPVVRAQKYPDDVAIGDMATFTDWKQILSGVQVVIHLAAKVHEPRAALEQLEDYRAFNTRTTIALAEAARSAGVRRFIFLSTIYRSRKPLDPSRPLSAPYQESDTPTPKDVYGISKWEAEQGLYEFRGGSMDVVIFRPPLIYGPGVKANFLRLLHAAHRRFPVPLGTVTSTRSMVYVENLVDALLRAAGHPDAANQLYLIADDGAVSTLELLRLLANYMDRQPPRVLPVPRWMLITAGKVLGRKNDVERLTQSLLVDDTKLRNSLCWKPPYSAFEGLKATVDWYRQEYVK